MKNFTLKFILVLTFLFMGKASFAQDWENLGRFKEENKKMTSPAPGENRIVFMGNSITEGWSQFSPEFFSGKPYVNRGIGGQTTPQMLLRFQADVVDLKPKVVVILAGTNDIAQNTGPITLEEIMNNLKAMAELAKKNNIKVILSSVVPAFDYTWRPGLKPNEKIPALNKMIQTYVEENDCIYLDYFKAMNDGNNGLQAALTYDGVHPNKAGYKVMEPLAEAAIAKALE